ncbi:MAG: hypothetical protein UH734_09285 [Ruminococcus sp.]|nr:hypothetical protein [Ruminococcus sp.]
MKQQNVKKWITAVLITVVLSLCAVSAVSAEEYSFEPETPQTDSVPQNDDIPETEPVYTEPVYTEEPVYTDPVVTEPETEYVAPVTEYVPPQTEYVNNVETTPTEFFEPPTLPKTISKKTYSTNYSAGIVSWVCVGIGVVVVIVVLVSTKLSGRRRGI